MSETKNIAQGVIEYLTRLKPDFESVRTGTITFEQECHFAKQIITKNDYILGIARGNPESLRSAITNLASIGLTLNPARKWAYLVPRKGANGKMEICLDIGYQGLCKLATDTGIVVWAQAKMVCEKDTFILPGIDEKPSHEYQPFGERGKYIGNYCVIKTDKGDYLTETMTWEDIEKIRAASPAYQSAEGKGKNDSPWHMYLDQMALKAVVKRASKMWPVSDGRLSHAVDMLNRQDGSAPLEEIEYQPTYTQEQYEELQQAIKDDNSAMVWHMSQTLPTAAWMDLYNSAPKGQKIKHKALITEMEKRGRQVCVDTADQITESISTGDEMNAQALYEDYTPMHYSLHQHLSRETLTAVQKIMEEAEC